MLEAAFQVPSLVIAFNFAQLTLKMLGFNSEIMPQSHGIPVLAHHLIKIKRTAKLPIFVKFSGIFIKLTDLVIKAVASDFNCVQTSLIIKLIVLSIGSSDQSQNKAENAQPC